MENKIILAEYDKIFNNMLLVNINKPYDEYFRKVYDVIYKQSQKDFDKLELWPNYGENSLN